jgi:hypothetical protein
VLEPFEVDPYAVGVKIEELGEFGCPGGALQLAEQREQPCPGRLRESVIRACEAREIDHQSFTYPRYGNQPRSGTFFTLAL